MRVIVGGILVILASVLVTSQVTTKVFAQTLPTCIDPTGKNLPCLIVISTLPTPTNAIHCQEPTGQILSCSYATQMLSNGQQVVVITVYVPSNFIFAGGPISVVKEIIVHETKTRIIHESECPKGQVMDSKTHKCVDIAYCPPPKDYHIDSITHKCVPDNCMLGQVYNPITGKCEVPNPVCERPDSDAVTDLDKDLKTKNCDTADANELNRTPFPSQPPPNCDSQTSNGTCPAPPGTNSTVPSNSKNIGKGGSSSEKNNVTAPIDCKTNPSDPSCPLTTKKCPDGSVVDASANCPTNMPPTPLIPPNPNNNPQTATNNNPSTNNPSENNPQSSPSNNPSPNSENGGSISSSSNSGGSGSKHHHHS
jgi:hypothetical protein